MATIGMGALGGAGTGAAMGSAIFPGIGTAIGAGIGAIVGGLSAKKRQDALKKATEGIENIPLVDPTQTEFADQIRREKRAIQSGFTTDFTAGKQVIDDATAAGMDVSSRVFAQNPALAIASMTRVQRQAGRQTSELFGIQGQKLGQYNQMLMDTINRIAQRKLDLSMHKGQQKLGMATQQYSDFQQNTRAGMFMLPQFTGEIKEGAGTIGSGVGRGIGHAYDSVRDRFRAPYQFPKVHQQLIERGTTPLNI